MDEEAPGTHRRRRRRTLAILPGTAGADVLVITLQDLRYRARRFLIAVIGTALVFAMTMLLAGLAAGFSVEIDQTVRGLAASTFVVAKGATGRLGALPSIPGSAVAAVGAEPGAGRVAPLILSTMGADVDGSIRSINLIGLAPTGLGAPTVVSGHPLARPGQVVVDRRLGVRVGTRVSVSGVQLVVVGTTTGRTLSSGIPNAYITLSDAQRAVFGGRDLVDAVLTSGRPSVLPAGLQSESDAQIISATLAQMSAAQSSISNFRLFMWLVAIVIVAALVYVSALERTRDFAVLKALGCSSLALFGGLALQAVAVALAAAAIAAVIANFMGGIFAQPVYVPSSAFVILPVSAVVIGLVASLAALRRAISVDPAMAFGGA